MWCLVAHASFRSLLILSCQTQSYRIRLYSESYVWFHCEALLIQCDDKNIKLNSPRIFTFLNCLKNFRYCSENWDSADKEQVQQRNMPAVHSKKRWGQRILFLFALKTFVSSQSCRKGADVWIHLRLKRSILCALFANSLIFQLDVWWITVFLLCPLHAFYFNSVKDAMWKCCDLSGQLCGIQTWYSRWKGYFLN